MKNLYPKLWPVLLLMGLISVNTGFSQFTIPLEVPDLFDTRSDTLYVDVENHWFGGTLTDSVQTLAYNHSSSGKNSYLGPTLTWMVGDTQTTHLINRLPSGPSNTTTVHWHGANIPAWTDGGPHQFFESGQTFTPKFKVLDAPSTLWYHPHAEDVTYTQVQMGLAGIIIVKDANDMVDPTLPNTYGQDDIPLIIQDIYFNSDTTIDTTQGPAGANSARIMAVNGTIQPFLDVPPQPIRFRILDGSTRNSYMLGFVTDTANATGSKIDFHLLSSDGGYLPDNVVTVDSLETSPGVRNGILVDFTNYAGSTLYMMNFPEQLRSGVTGRAPNGRPPLENTILKINVGSATIPPIGAIPTSLPAIPALATPDTSRIIRLTGISGDTTNRFGIDDNQYEYYTINTVVDSGSVEDWTIRNESNKAHPFHIHLIQFFVQKVEDTAGNALPFPVEYLGPKDDILVHPGEQVTFRAHFDSYAQPKPFNLDSSAYMYHCHILTHEDGYYGGSASTISGRSPWGMMQQFAVWNGKVNLSSLTQPIEDGMVLFPNPAGNELYLNGESPKLSTVRVYDLQGKKLMEKLLPPFSGTTTINVASLNRGLVLVEWQSPAGRLVKKVMLK